MHQSVCVCMQVSKYLDNKESWENKTENPFSLQEDETLEIKTKAYFKNSKKPYETLKTLRTPEDI